MALLGRNLSKPQQKRENGQATRVLAGGEQMRLLAMARKWYSAGKMEMHNDMAVTPAG